jgi:hypothetical protein
MGRAFDRLKKAMGEIHNAQQPKRVDGEPLFYLFCQNNSGGWFEKDDERGLGPRVWIEARDVNEANYRAKLAGIYFNGCDDGTDCNCCGDRWYEAWEDGKEKPEIDPEYDFSWYPKVFVHHLSGKIETIDAPEDARILVKRVKD